MHEAVLLPCLPAGGYKTIVAACGVLSAIARFNALFTMQHIGSLLLMVAY